MPLTDQMALALFKRAAQGIGSVSNKAVSNKLLSPLVMPWKLSPEAQQFGLNVAAAHGTRTASDYDKFRLPINEIGVHFGTPEAAAVKSGVTNNYLKANPEVSPFDEYPFNTRFRTIPAGIQARNPLVLPDLGNWRAGDVRSAMLELHPSQFPSPSEFHSSKPLSGAESLQRVKDILNDRGYDSLMYKNQVEDPGSTSYILYNQSKKDPGYLAGARLPWARFQDPDTANLLGSLAGGAVVGNSLLNNNDNMAQALQNKNQ